MRIAFVTETWRPSVDGVVTRLDHTVNELVRRGHDVLVVAPTVGPETPGVVQERTRGFVVPLIDRRRRWGLPDPRVVRFVRDFDPDVVHVVSPALMGTWAVRQLADAFPLLASLHTDLAAYAGRYHLGATRPLLRQLNRAAYRTVDLALATSPTGLELLTDLGVTNASIWSPGVDREVFFEDGADPVRRSVGDGGRALQVVCVGRLAREKGYDVLRPVLEPGSSDEPQVQLTFVGDGPDRHRLSRVFRGTPTTFVGALKGPPLASAYRSADVVAFTSTTETVGLVLLEAAALGLAVVAVDTRASRDTLADYPRARLVPQGASTTRWRAAFVDAAATPHHLGTAAGAAAVATWATSTDELLDAYARVSSRVLSRSGPAVEPGS
jgi:glycosyltransferase involved in cell wall biosynthesis